MKEINLTINSKLFAALEGSTIAAVLMNIAEAKSFRRSVSGAPRLPLCGMGVCFECRVTINGIRHRRSCQTLVSEGMRIETDD